MRNPAVDEVCRRVSEALRVPVEAMLDLEKNVRAGGQTTAATAARRVAMWFVRATWVPRPSYPEIARYFGYRKGSHQAAIKAFDLIEDEIRRGTPLGLAADRLRKPASVPPPKLRVVG